jgi:hypothetical protein
MMMMMVKEMMRKTIVMITMMVWSMIKIRWKLTKKTEDASRSTPASKFQTTRSNGFGKTIRGTKEYRDERMPEKKDIMGPVSTEQCPLLVGDEVGVIEVAKKREVSDDHGMLRANVNTDQGVKSIYQEKDGSPGRGLPEIQDQWSDMEDSEQKMKWLEFM